MTIIHDALMRKIIDSRGKPTVEVEIYTDCGVGIAAAPSGMSTGIHEVQAFPKGNPDGSIRFFYDKVLPAIVGMDATSQRAVDDTLHELDGTENFSAFGGNAAVATSLACAKSAAASLGVPLYRYLGGAMAEETPFPLGNVLGGGAHAIGGPDIQEFLVMATGPSALESVFGNANVYHRVKEALKKEFPNTALGKGDEGAWVAPIGNTRALELVAKACAEASKELDFTIHPCLDMAASEFHSKGKYHYKEQTLDTKGQIKFVAGLVDKFHLHSVEDPLDQDDWDGYAKLTEEVGDRCLIIGDDFFTTNVERLEKGIERGCANAILIKPNQIGTLTDTYEAVSVAHRCGYATIMSHRSGETTDTTIAHLGVAFGCHALKTGAVGGERIAKLNELIRIEEEMKRN